MGVHKSESRGQQRAQIRFSIHQTTISIFCEDNHIYADLIRLAPSLRGFNLINLVAILKLVALLHPHPPTITYDFLVSKYEQKRNFWSSNYQTFVKPFVLKYKKIDKTPFDK